LNTASFLLMQRKTSIIPKATLSRLMMRIGASRVSDDACQELSEYLADYAVRISKKAYEIAAHSGRKTVNAGDVKLAAK